MVDHIDRLADRLSKMPFSENVGLLYPGSDSLLLDQVSEDQHPKHLVVLDGTWHHTKTLVRDIPSIQRLPRFRLAPTQPSRYKIRREPNSLFLSTLEATVAALQCLEPETEGFPELVSAFDEMIEDQVSLPMSGYGWRRNHRRGHSPLNIPRVLQEHIESIVVVYGETAPGFKGDRHRDAKSEHVPIQPPVYWVAERLVSGERFECAIEPPNRLSTTFLEHLQLPEGAFRQPLSIDQFRAAWSRFVRPTDVIAFYYSNIPKLLTVIGGRTQPRVHLKSIRIDGARQSRSLEEMLVDLCVPLSPIHCNGRAGMRLASTVAFASHLHRLATS
jgi:hypothetical protein